MTEHNPGDVVGLFANTVQIEVTTDHADQRNSYRTIATSGDDATTATVTVEAGHTFFTYGGETFMFDGVNFRPNSDYRDDDELDEDGEVDLVFPDGFQPEMGHRFNPETGRYTVGNFVADLLDGRLEPTTNPNSTHD
jgi:hypothetical protein